MNQKITFKDVIVAGSAAQNHDKCFSYVFEEHRIENFQTIFLNYNRDFDVLQEALGNFEYIMVIFHECANNWKQFFGLGAIQSKFFLKSDHYVSDRLLNQIDKTTSRMIENGLHHFYLSFSGFMRKLVQRTYNLNLNDDDDGDDVQALTMEQLKRPMIFLLGIFAIATMIFVIEIILGKWIKRRAHNHAQ